MSFDKNLWASIVEFQSLASYPALPCPYCKRLKLKVDEPSVEYRGLTWSADNKEVRRSLETKQREVVAIYGENQLLGFLAGVGAVVGMLDYAPAKFVGYFSCEECGGDVAVAGTAMLKKKSARATTSPLFKVEYFSPPVPMFDFAASTPKPIVDEVLQAFQHFHCDLTASGAKIRRAMEKVCSTLGYAERTLHHTIEAMGRDYPMEASWLGTLKLVGNEATHSDGIDEDDLLNSFHVLEAVLDIFRRKAMEKEVALVLPELEGKFKRLEPPK